MPDGGETQIAWRMGRQVYVNTRDGSSTGEEEANAAARVRVDIDQLLREGEQEKQELELERLELEQALAEETDPAVRDQLANDLKDVNSDLADIQADMDGLANHNGTVAEYDELVSQKELLRDEIRSEEAILQEESYDPVQIARNHTLRPDYIDNLKSRLADLEAGRGRGFFNTINDGVVDLGEFLAPGSIIEVVPIGKIPKYIKRLKRLRKLRERLKRLRQAKKEERVKRKGERKRRSKDRCTKRSNPVSMETGLPVHDDPMFEVPGAIPIVIGSSYVAERNDMGPFGRRRASEIDVSISQVEGRLRFTDEQGEFVYFERPLPKPGVWEDGDTFRGLKISAGENRALIIKEDNLLRHFKKFEDGRWLTSFIEDQSANKLLFSRRSDGRLESIETPEGLRVQFQYGRSDLRTSASLEGIDGGSCEIMRWEYSESGDMLLADAVYGSSIAFEYDLAGRKIVQRHSHGYEALHSYDDRGRVIGVHTNGPYNGDRFEYDDDLAITTYYPGGDVDKLEKFYIDNEGVIFAQANALGHIKRTEFNDAGYLAAEIDAEGNRTSYTYDANGYVKTVTDPEGRRNFLYWDETGRIEITIDDAGNSWDYEYDERGNVVSIVDPLKNRSDISYDERGRPVGIMRHDGLVETRKYDDRGNMTEILNYRGQKTLFAYDRFNRVTAVTDPLGNVSRFEYQQEEGHSFWHPSRIIRPDGASQSIRTDRVKAEVTVTDDAGRAVRYRHGFGPNNLLTEVHDPHGGVIKLFYDHLQQLSSVENQKGLRWTFERDVLGRIIKETDFDGITVAYEYDAADRAIVATYADGAKRLFEYDRSGLLVEEQAVDAGTGAPETTAFWYDQRGLMVGARNRQASVAFERDALGRVISESTNGRTILNSYDCCGNRIERKIDDQIVAYAFDPMGALKSLTIGSHSPLNFERDRLGQEVKRTSPAGFQLDQAWDIVGQLKSQVSGGKGLAEADRHSDVLGFTPQVARAYEWSRTSEPSSINDSNWGSTQFEYDDNSQILESRFGDGRSEHFSYDKALGLNGSGANDAGARGPRHWQWAVSQGGRVEDATTARGERFRMRWDARGRMIEKRVERNGFRPRVWRYEWDASDRMIGCISPDLQRWRYGYDPFGRRLWKRNVTTAEAGFVSQSHQFYGQKVRSGGSLYLWDGDQVAEEVTLSADATPLERTHWHYEPNSFRPMAKQNLEPDQTELSPEGFPQAQSRSVLYFVVTDQLGTPRELFSENGTPIWMAEYGTWGTPRRLWVDNSANDNIRSSGIGWGSIKNVSLHPGIGATASGAAAGRWFAVDSQTSVDDEPELVAARQMCPIRFQGQWEDEETGLCYNRHRHYDCDLGIYTARDPIGIMGGGQVYAYAVTPTVTIDPLGLSGYRDTAESVGCYYFSCSQVHHLIPKAVWRDNPFLNNVGAYGGVNGPFNLMPLPKDGLVAKQESLLQHQSHHDPFNKYVQSELDPIRRQYDQDLRTMGKPCADKKARQAIARLQMQLRAQIYMKGRQFPGQNIRNVPWP